MNLCFNGFDVLYRVFDNKYFSISGLYMLTGLCETFHSVTVAGEDLRSEGVEVIIVWLR